MTWRPRGLYLVTPDEPDSARLLARVAPLLPFAALLLYRNKGASCYDDLGRARVAAAAGASYLAFGALFPSPTKPGARRADPGLLGDARPLGLPLVAIGGITPENAGVAVAAGADLVAVIGGVFDAPDPVAAARALRACFHP